MLRDATEASQWVEAAEPNFLFGTEWAQSQWKFITVGRAQIPMQHREDDLNLKETVGVEFGLFYFYI